MPDKFAITIQDGIQLLDGPIDENADLTPLFNTKGRLRLNLKNISKINSIGIASWLKLMKAWEGKPVEFHDVSHVMVTNANIMPMFFNLKDPTKKIKSLQVPYFCEHCDEPYEIFCNDFEIVFKNDNAQLPKKLCQKCGRSLDLDVDDDYFDFYARNKK